MSEREARASNRQVERMADGRTIDLMNYEEVETGAHGTRMRETEASPHTLPAVPDPQGDTVFNGDFGVGTSYEVVFLVARAELPGPVTDTGSKEAASRVLYDGTTFVVQTINDFIPAGVTVLGCDEGDEP